MRFIDRTQRPPHTNFVVEMRGGRKLDIAHTTRRQLYGWENYPRKLRSASKHVRKNKNKKKKGGRAQERDRGENLSTSLHFWIPSLATKGNGRGKKNRDWEGTEKNRGGDTGPVSCIRGEERTGDSLDEQT